MKITEDFTGGLVIGFVLGLIGGALFAVKWLCVCIG